MKFFAIGEDKSLVDVTTLVLSKMGGTMEGDISYKGSKTTNEAIKFLNNTANNYGNGMSLGAGGVVIIGAGEAGAAIESMVSADLERLILASDTNIVLYLGVEDGINNAVQVSIDKYSGIWTNHQKKITSGTAAPSGGSSGDIYIQY